MAAHDDAGAVAGQQLRDEADAQDVGVAVLPGEAEALAEGWCGRRRRRGARPGCRGARAPGRSSSAMVLLPEPDSPVNQSVNPVFSSRTWGSFQEVIDVACVRCSGLVAVQAALDLARAPPAAGPFVAALAVDRGRARNAPDRRVAMVVQRVVGDAVPPDVPPDVAARPVGKGLHLDDAATLVQSRSCVHFARVVDWSRRIPVTQASIPSSACSSGATLRIPQQASGSRSQSRAPCSSACWSTGQLAARSART